MNKRILTGLIVLMAIALVGMVVVQIHWVENAITMRQEDFRQNVNTALASVVEDLEQSETLETLRSHQQGRFLFFESDSVESLDQALADSLYDYVRVTDINRTDEEVFIDIVEEQDGHRVTKTFSKSIDDGLHESDLEALRSEIDLTYEGSGDDRHLVNEQQNGFDSILNLRVQKKTAIVGDIVKSLIEVNIFGSIEERVDQNVLDSVLAVNFEDLGITTGYEFAVFDGQQEPRMGRYNGAGLAQVQDSEYHTRLFPNDVWDSKNTLKVWFPKKTGFILKTMWLMLGVSALFTLLIVFGFYYSIMTIIRQKKLSVIKNDFINNMTHELKTPISTISLACEALADPDIGGNANSVKRYIGMIGDENKRLGLLVEEVLQSAVLDRGDFKLKPEQVDVHQLIRNVVDKIGIQVREREGKITTQLEAPQHQLKADRVHLANVFYNLIDNANKYSPGQPEITVTSRNERNGITISVADKGIGISRENVKKVFDRLYRVPTGNRHDVKGFGLGLNYVKIIAERHGGEVGVKSELHKGSRFEVHLPFATT